MQWFDLEGETAGGNDFRTSRPGASMVDAIQAFEDSHPGWTVQAAYALTPAMERAKKVMRAVMAENPFKTEFASPLLMLRQTVKVE